MTHTRNNRITAFSLFFAALVALLFSMPLAAQQTGEIAGKVTNAADGSPISGVSIQATGPRLPGERSTTTLTNGDFRLPLLPPGNYTVVFTLPDGSTRTRATDVLLQQRTTLNLPVDFGADAAALEEVLVTASNVLMETSGSSISGAIDSETFDALPVGQEYRDLIKLIPGVQFTQDAVRGPSAGGHGQDNTYQFDGVDVSLPLFGVLSAEPSTHDIDQVSIVRGGATAVGFNRSGGFKVNTISKSGTNEFHGMISYQLQDASWESDRDYESATDFDQTLDWTTANFSGPLIKDRLFFYASYYAPTVERDNRANAYGEVPDYTSERDEYFGKLTWAVTDDFLLEGSVRSADTEVRNSGVGSFESPEASSGSDSTLDIVILEGNWVINANSSAYFKYTNFENEAQDRPDLVLDATPAVGASLDLDNLDRLGQFQVPTLRGDPMHDAWAQPLIDRYGYVEDGVRQGGGSVGAATLFNDQNFYRESFEIGYDLTLEFGSWVHNLHFGYHQEEIEEYLFRYSNGWGFIDSPGGVEQFEGQPVYFLATFQQSSLAGIDVSPIRSFVETRNIEINDSIEWGDWTFNLGVLFSEDTLYGQGLAVNKNNPSGFELAPGKKYEMHEESFSDMMQPRLGVTWDFADNMSTFANYARYYPSATSLARAASWDRNTGNLRVDAYFDENGDMIGIETYGASSGKLFQDGIDPRHVDEFILGFNWEVTDRLTTRTHYRRREARDMWEDTPNNMRVLERTNGLPGTMPDGWAPKELYIPDLGTYSELGLRDSSYVIAQLDRAYTDYDEISFEAEWQGDNWYLQGSYTWSRYRGNFDQDNTTTANDQAIFIGSSNLADGYGRNVWDMKDGTLRGDRPHLFKIYGYYELPWEARMGFYALYQSGQPWETWDGAVYGFSSDTIRYAEPAGSRRSDAHYQLDLNYTQNFWFGSNKRYGLQLRADLYNVFDNQTGYNINPVLDSAGYGLPRNYYNPRRLQLLAKFMF